MKAVPGLTPRWNIAPGSSVLVIRDVRESGREASTSIKWGLVPYWAKDPAVGNHLINARSESAHEKPAFEGPFKSRRCLLPADGFFEWEAVPGQKRKRPWYVSPADGEGLALGGLWDAWRAPTGEVIETCTILTVPANALLAPIHDRMPVLIGPENYDAWISEKTPLAAAKAMCAPAAESALVRGRVSLDVNSADNDSPAVIEAVNDKNE